MKEFSTVEKLAINTIRILSAEAIQKANSGHPGMPMGVAPLGFYLYAKVMKHNPKNSKWLNRDRFILSAGHGSMLLYSCLHLCGYNISLDDIKNFRQWGSKTPGHPEYGLTEGVETTTGPLGQGFANAVGMALAQEYLASRFNTKEYKIFDHYIYGICSEGDLMEGISHESASLAGHLGLGKIIFFYDENQITIDGSTSLTLSDDVVKRFEAYNWHTEVITDINDLEQLDAAISRAQNDKRPSLLIAKTIIGYGSPNKAGKSEVHGAPLGKEELALTKANLGWNYSEEFFVPDEVKNYFQGLKPVFQNYEDDWNKLFEQYKNDYPEKADELMKILKGEISNEWFEHLSEFIDDGKKLATRQASGKVMNVIAKFVPNFIGGSADLSSSVNCTLNGYGVFSKENYSGRNIHFGIREHGMAGILNGMALYGGIIPYGATFLVFVDYLRPTLRLAALSELKVIYIFTHDSIGLGEDGPTHQPIEQIASLRSIPELVLIRPCDANETRYAWKYAMEHKRGPIALIFTRQAVPVLDSKKNPNANQLEKGAYIIYQNSTEPDILILASGSEVHLALESIPILEENNLKIRIISFPSWELFEKQTEEYKKSILPDNIKKRLVIEAGVSMGWERYCGEKGKMITIDKYGASAPEKVLFEKYGFTKENVLQKCLELMKEN